MNASSNQTRVGLMTAAVIAAPGKVELAKLPIPDPQPGEVRIRLEGCGVCASNIPPWEGRDWFSYPMAPGALGHEGWGRIDALGAGVRGLDLGQRVAFLSNGSYAEYDTAPANSVVPLPAMLLSEPFPGEPLGCAVNIFRRSKINAGSTVAIVGIGFLGAILTRLAANAGANVVAIARRQYARDLAFAMGASVTVPMDEAREKVSDFTRGEGCDVVIEATGKQAPLDLAAALTKVRGRLVIAGYHQDGLRQVNMQEWNWRGIDVINAHERDNAVYIQGIREAIEAVAYGALDPSPLYTHRLPLTRLDEALELARARPDGFTKALVEMREL